MAQRRHQLRLTQPDLADLADVSVGSVQAAESGKETLRVDVLTAILDALGLALVVVSSSRARQLAQEGGAAVVQAAPSGERGAEPDPSPS